MMARALSVALVIGMTWHTVSAADWTVHTSVAGYCMETESPVVDGNVWCDSDKVFTGLSSELIVADSLHFRGPAKIPDGNVLTFSGGNPGTFYALLNEGWACGQYRTALPDAGWTNQSSITASRSTANPDSHSNFDVFSMSSDGSDVTLPACVGDWDGSEGPPATACWGVTIIWAPENTCNAIDSFDSGVVGGDSDPCTTSTALTSVSDTSCNVKCDTGYFGGTGTYQCSSSGGPATSSLTCTACTAEGNCDPGYFFDDTKCDGQGSTDDSCVACTTTFGFCTPGSFADFTKCTGSGSTDDSCSACTAEGNCDPGYFFDDTKCDGQGSTDNSCVACGNGGQTYDCGAGNYQSGTSCDGNGASDSQTCDNCFNFTAESSIVDDSCTACDGPAQAQCSSAVCEDGYGTYDNNTGQCSACTGSTYSDGSGACVNWDELTAADCDDGNEWIEGTASTNSECGACTGKTWSTGGAACGNWTYLTPADCSDGQVYVEGDAFSDSTCPACTGTTYSTGGAACGNWTQQTVADCSEGEGWAAGTASTDSSCTGKNKVSVTFSVTTDPTNNLTAIAARLAIEAEVPASQVTVTAAATDGTWELTFTVTELNSADAADGVSEFDNATEIQEFLDAVPGVSLTAHAITQAAAAACEVLNAVTFSGDHCTIATCVAGFQPASVCEGCTGSTFSDGNGPCNSWTLAECPAGQGWAEGTASTDSTCPACLGVTWSDSNDGGPCEDWTYPTAADCTDDHSEMVWTAGTSSTDSTCTDAPSTSSGATLWSVLALAAAALVARV